MPGAVEPRTLVQPIDIATDGLEREHRPSVQDLVAQEVAILAEICTNIEDAVDVLMRQHGAQMEGKVPSLHLAQGHDFITEETADSEDRMLDEPQHSWD